MDLQMTKPYSVRLDNLEDGYPSKSQFLDLAEQKKVNIYLNCYEQQGLLFSEQGDKVIAHQEGIYSGLLELSLDASSLLAKKGEHLVTVGRITDIDGFNFHPAETTEVSNYLYDEWSPITSLSQSEAYGFFLNVSLGQTFESSINNHSRFEMLSRTTSMEDLRRPAFCEMRGTMKDVCLLGQAYTLNQARILSTQIEELRAVLNSELTDKSNKKRRRAIYELIAKVTQNLPHFSAQDIWNVLYEESQTNGLRIYDEDLILVGEHCTEDTLYWLNNKGQRTPLRRSNFDSLLSRIRTELNLRIK